MPASRKRVERDERDPCECPVCFEAFEATGPRTKVRSYLCEGGLAHVICSACDKTLYVRHDDRCPVCRAGRSGTSVQRNGARPSPMSLPVPMSLPMSAGSYGGDGQGVGAVTDFLSWLPRRIGAGSHVLGARRLTPHDAERPAVAPASGAAGAYGDDQSFMARFRAASASRRSRTNQVVMLHNPVAGISILDQSIDLTGDDEAVEAALAVATNEIETSADAALAVLLSDEGVGTALEGLRDPTSMTAGEFVRRVNEHSGGREVAPRGR